jgi:hypothetical protein
MFFTHKPLAVLLALLPLTAWPQQSATPPLVWPQVFFWQVNSYPIQPWIWTAPAPQQRIPFPTPFWLWPPQPAPQAMPTPQVPPMTQVTAPPAKTLDSGPPLVVETQPAVSPEPPTASPISPPPVIDTAPAPTVTEPTASPAQTNSAPSDLTDPVAVQAAPIMETPVRAASSPIPAPQPKPVKKPQSTKKPSKKLRKLCWKDGRLDVCP